MYGLIMKEIFSPSLTKLANRHCRHILNVNPNLRTKIVIKPFYAEIRGAVAAPTAGLHFTSELLKKVEEKGVKVIPIVLHLGLGSFRPVVVEDLSRHKMDSEFYDITDEAAEQINETKKNKKKVIAVGTSVVRGLETSVTSEGWAKQGPWLD